MAKIDFTKYSFPELIDIQFSINKEKYPESYDSLMEEIDNRSKDNTIDYSKYSLSDLLKIKSIFNKEKYPENFNSLVEAILPQEGKYERKKFLTAEKRVKFIGILQLLSVIIIPFYYLKLYFEGYYFNHLLILILILIILFNAVCGYTAFNNIRKYYWLSLTNQYLQLLSFSIAGFQFNYSGLGGIFFSITFNFIEFSWKFNPDFILGYQYNSTEPGHISVDIIAIFFIIALTTAKRKNVPTKA